MRHEELSARVLGGRMTNAIPVDGRCFNAAAVGMAMRALGEMRMVYGIRNR